jgi:hypothetical protein
MTMSSDTDIVAEDLREVLAGVSYPAEKWDIIACAEIYGVAAPTRRRLYHLPVRRYVSASEVAATVGPLETT